MAKTLFISLPVTELSASTAFYKALGFSQNPQFSGEDGSAMVWSEAIHVMLVTHAKWRTFTQRPFPPAGSCGMMLSPGPGEPRRRRRDERGRRGPWRAGRCEPDGGRRLHVHPRPGRSRRSHVGGALDGPGGDARGRWLNNSGHRTAVERSSKFRQKISAGLAGTQTVKVEPCGGWRPRSGRRPAHGRWRARWPGPGPCRRCRPRPAVASSPGTAWRTAPRSA